MNTSSAARIKPTVGRVVWYYPPTNAAEPGFARPEDGIPCAAIIARVWSDACVNLTVFDACGAAHPRTNVRLVQDGEEPPEHAGHCEWMPFQKGQAKAQEQLPAHASFPIGVRVGPYSDAELARARPVETKTYSEGTTVIGAAPLAESPPAQEGPRIDLGRYAGTYGGYRPDPLPTGWQRLRKRLGGWIAGGVPQ